jgi:hypothetical protein
MRLSEKTFITARNTLLNKLDADDTLNQVLFNGRKRREMPHGKFYHLPPINNKHGGTRTLKQIIF